MPSRYYAGTFSLQGRHLTVPTARGAPPLDLRLTRHVPYQECSVRSVTLVNAGPKLFVDVTAEVPVASYEEGAAPDPQRVAGVDLGIIHPFALASTTGGLVVSGRAIRAENRLHLAEKKARARSTANRAPKKGQAGSRRWKQYRRRTRKLEERHRRRVSQATHEAARAVVDFAVESRIGTVVVGDPRGLLKANSGRRQNLAVANWRPGQAIGALKDKAALAASLSNWSMSAGRVRPAHAAGPRWPSPRAGGSVVFPADWSPTEMWWVLPTSPREGLGAENPLTQLGWRSCTVEPAGICPDGPGVIHDESRWTTIEMSWVPGPLWLAPSASGSRSIGSLRRPDRGIARSARRGRTLAVTALTVGFGRRGREVHR